jgi:hypothetical protein
MKDRNRRVGFFDPLTPTLSLGERGQLDGINNE